MKILEVVLYSRDGKKNRCIKFNEDGVTIISGKEKTGKTALLEIVQYCLGSDDCRVPEGIIRDNVSWYGIRLQFQSDQMFIARKNPEKGKQSTNQAIYIIKQNVNIPSEITQDSETNIENIIEILTNKIGITENLHRTDQEHTRSNLEARIKHALFYCFQDQNDIGTKKYLFHKQSEEFIPQAMRDTLPYLLGAVREDRLQNENELTTKKRELNKIRKKVKEEELINGNSFSKAQLLLTQAQEIGIINKNIYKLDTLEDYRNVLEIALDWKPDQVNYPNYNEIDNILFKMEPLKYEKRELEDKISSTYNFINASENYYGELGVQKNRLESVGIYKKLNLDKNETSQVEYTIPYIEQIQESLIKVNEELKSVERERPRLLKYIEELKQEKESIIDEINQCQNKIDALYQQEGIANRYKELNTRRGIIIGKIMLWLESVIEIDQHSQLIHKLNEAEKEVDRLEEFLSQEDIEDKTASILNRIGTTITTLAQELGLEHGDNPIRFDLRNLTVVADRPDKPISLEKMGGAANWVGYHLAVHLALHKHFIENNCPVPRFLFLDQPSYAYFPEELKSQQDINDNMLKIEDREAITKVYDFIFDTVEKLDGKIQVIITDHAMLNNSRFRKYLKEIWRIGQPYEALIPKEWYK